MVNRFGEFLSKLRKDKGLTQVELGLGASFTGSLNGNHKKH